jgi:hypothetical protein
MHVLDMDTMPHQPSSLVKHLLPLPTQIVFQNN